MPSPRPEKLSRREREIMDALFALGNRASAEEVRTRLTDPPSYSAVRAMLVRLEAKGYIRHREEGVRYVYSPTTAPAAARRAALRQALRTFFGGSLGDMATTLLRDETWTDEELDRLSGEIERARTLGNPKLDSPGQVSGLTSERCGPRPLGGRRPARKERKR